MVHSLYSEYLLARFRLKKTKDICKESQMMLHFEDKCHTILSTLKNYQFRYLKLNTEDQLKLDIVWL